MGRFVFIIVILLLIAWQAGFVYASDPLQVTKLIENTDIKVGDGVSIGLKFTNPFGKEIPVKIVDKNVFGNNGIDIQCLEQIIPSQRESILKYEAIKPFTPGTYTLASAEIMYTNPETGKEETVKSNILNVDVKGTAQQGQAQGITTIYQCNGMSMHSTSYSSSDGSLNIQIGGSNSQQQSSQQQSSQDRVQNNQMNQNTGALKQEMEQQVQKQKEMEQEFQQNLAKSQEFQEQHQGLLNSGYNISDASFNPTTNDTGSFEISYQKPDGKTATLKGEMENKTISNIMSQTSEDREKMLHTLYNNTQFQAYHQRLASKGFNQTQPEFNQLSQNYTQITIPYVKHAAKRAITADYTNGTIMNVALDDNEAGEDFWWLLLIPIIAVLGWVIYTRYLKKNLRTEKKPENRVPELKIVKPIDYVKEARKMIQDAIPLFESGKEKDSYEKVSQAIRFYFSYKLGIKNEIINSELVSILKKQERKRYPEVKKCLDLCAMVEFAKYKPNKEDFKEIIKIAEDIVTDTRKTVNR